MECIAGSKCSEKKCKLLIFHWHCEYCKEVGRNWCSTRRNCDLCSGEKTAKQKLSRVKKEIKKGLKMYCEGKKESEKIDILKSMIKDIRYGSKHFHGTYEDIEIIINNFFDKSKPLPLINVNFHHPINLNNSRKKKEFDDTNITYLNLVKENNRGPLYINCSYDDKDDCKSLGGRWDRDKKSWYIPIGIDSSKFKKWL